jgi:hypothetical protein
MCAREDLGKELPKRKERSVSSLICGGARALRVGRARGQRPQRMGGARLEALGTAR